eukprot:scaffold122467_cov13-Tisochrysis_lutea.AAC.1
MAAWLGCLVWVCCAEWGKCVVCGDVIARVQLEVKEDERDTRTGLKERRYTQNLVHECMLAGGGRAHPQFHALCIA